MQTATCYLLLRSSAATGLPSQRTLAARPRRTLSRRRPHPPGCRPALPPAPPHPPDPKLDVTNDADGKHARLVFEGAAAGGGGAAYALDLPLYAAVDKGASKLNVLPRHVFLVLEKKEPGSWPRLTKESSKGDKHIKARAARRRRPGGGGAGRGGAGRVGGWGGQALGSRGHVGGLLACLVAWRLPSQQHPANPRQPPTHSARQAAPPPPSPSCPITPPHPLPLPG